MSSNLFSTLQRIVSWACDNGHFSVHNLLKVKRRATGNRSDIIWMTEEINLFRANTPRYVGNILLVATETGLRPGDLARLSWQQIQVRDDGTLRILIKTNKSGRNKFASVPVTPRLEEFLVTVPKDQPVFLLSETGEPFEAENSLGKLVSKWRDRLGIRKELHFYDARGTAVTRLVAAGCTVGELAAHMGWSASHAAAMLDRYARIDPDMTDGIRDKLVAADEKRARARAKTDRESGHDDQSSPT